MTAFGLPGHHNRRFTVTSGRATDQRVTASDGTPLETDDLLKYVTYVGDLYRSEEEWKLIIQWVDLNGQGNRIALPHEVVEKVLSHAKTIMAAARSDRAQRAADTRRLKASEADQDEAAA